MSLICHRDMSSLYVIRICHCGIAVCHRGISICHRGIAICHRGISICHRGIGICHRDMSSGYVIAVTVNVMYMSL